MPTKKITISSLKEITQSQTLWDTEIKGFGCRRQKGEDKVFILKYRFGKGRSARQYIYTIGKLGSPWTADMARDEAKRLLGRVANGENPAEDRQLDKTAKTVEETFALFIDDSHGKRASRTVTEYSRLYEKCIKHQICRHRVLDVSTQDIRKIHSALSKTPPQANRVLQMLSAFFNWCEENGYRPEYTNPCRHIKKYKEFNKERFLSEIELVALSNALKSYENDYFNLKEISHKKNKNGQGEINKTTPYVVAAIRLLIFTGARRNEILTLNWKDVDFANRLIRLQQSKTGQKTIYLSAPALQILSDIPQIHGNPYVICGAKEKSRLVNIKDPWNRIRKMATLNIWEDSQQLADLIGKAKSGLPADFRIDALYDLVLKLAKKSNINLPVGLIDVRIHDLRHNFASTAVTSGHHLKVIGSLLGQKNSKTTERYAHLANDPIQTANEAISNRILQSMKIDSSSQSNSVRKLKG